MARAKPGIWFRFEHDEFKIIVIRSYHFLEERMIPRGIDPNLIKKKILQAIDKILDYSTGVNKKVTILISSKKSRVHILLSARKKKTRDEVVLDLITVSGKRDFEAREKTDYVIMLPNPYDKGSEIRVVFSDTDDPLLQEEIIDHLSDNLDILVDYDLVEFKEDEFSYHAEPDPEEGTIYILLADWNRSVRYIKVA